MKRVIAFPALPALLLALCLHASAADGMVLSTPLSVDPGSDASVKVFYNGSEYTGNLRTLNQVGEYVVSAQVGGQNQRLLGFTLVGGEHQRPPYLRGSGRILYPQRPAGRGGHLHGPLQRGHGARGRLRDRI